MKRTPLTSEITPRSHRLSQTERIIRDEAVAAYVKRAAKGKCDLCEQDAPFISRDNEPFLECHHVHHLARGGPDVIENAVARWVSRAQQRRSKRRARTSRAVSAKALVRSANDNSNVVRFGPR